jgi:hypothetical protein
VDPVDGKTVKPVAQHSYASTQRKPYGDCGDEGKLFVLESDPVKLMRNRHGVPAKSMVKAVAVIGAYTMLIRHLVGY